VSADPGRAVLLLVLNAVPTGLLLLFLGGIAVRDFFQPARSVEVAIQDEKSHTPRKKHAYTVEIEDKEGRLDSMPGVGSGSFLIEDEPPERTGGVAAVKVSIEDEPTVEPKGKGSRLPIELRPYIRYDYNPADMRYGMTALRDHKGRQLNKLITYSPVGGTSDTRVKIDGQEIFYGGGGQWLKRNENLPNDPAAESFQRTASTWQTNGMHITQVLEIVPSQQPVQVKGEPKRVLDTVLVRYVVENKSGGARRFGMRSHVDTLIGSNDGVPFTVPGIGLINTFAEFPSPRYGSVPSFIQALEYGSLQNPGTVAHMTLKLGGKYETPSRVMLTHWSSGTGVYNGRLLHMGNDSAVLIFWAEKLMQPNERREMGFAYGLGGVTADEGQGKLGITLAGSFEPGQMFTVSAYIANPTAGQTATLSVPGGLEVQGKATAPVPPPQGALTTSLVTWQVKVLSEGKHRLEVKTSNGLSQAKTITIQRPEIPAGGDLTLALKGSFEPGQTFTITADVKNPVANQTLNLKLPDGLQLGTGNPQQNVPPTTDGKSSLAWSVRVMKAGRYPIKVASSTGVTHTKTITILEPEEGAGRFEVSLKGDFEPGKKFHVTAKVENPLPKQTVKLELPEGLVILEEKELRTVPPPAEAKGTSKVSWPVRIEKTGRYLVRVASNTGVVRRKTLTIGKVDLTKGAFKIDLVGTLEPKKVFTVKARVTDPVPNQTLKLILPEQMEVVDSRLKQDVPTANARGEAVVSWDVRIMEAGSLRIRVESSTGAYRQKTILLQKNDGDAGIFGGTQGR
jgi:predicted secreted protein